MTPLDVLLSRALLDLTRSCEREGAVEVVLWSNLLRVIGDDGVAVKDLPTTVRLSRRAVRSTLNCVQRRKWLVASEGSMRLVGEAVDARDAWSTAIVRAESAWPSNEVVRGPLEEFVARLPLEHSHYPCGYGTADWRITGGPGVDWRPVPRDPDADSVSSTSTLALLSQALVGFTVEYEARVPFALLVGAHLDATFTDETFPLGDAPTILGIKGNGKTSLERHGAVVVDDGRVTLTDLGRSVRDAYRPTVEAVEATMASTTKLRVALEAHETEHEGHALHPDVRFVGGGVGFAEVSARDDLTRRTAPA